MTEDFKKSDETFRVEQTEKFHKIGTVRRLLPQIIVSIIKSLILLNKSCVDGLLIIVIPSLLGISTKLNSDEKIRITAVQASWLSSLTFIGHPFGSLLSGFVSDRLGRRTALMVIVAPAILAFIMLAFADSFLIICLAFFSLSFIFGLKDAPATVYVSEISEPSARGTLFSFAQIAISFGSLLVNSLNMFLSWRHVSLAVSILPVIIVSAIYFIPETPNWLLSKNRPKDAQRSLQWLRGWVTADAVHDEFKRLENHSQILNACIACSEQSLKCYHSQITFCDKLVELKLKRTLKPLILVLCLFIILELSPAFAIRAYTIQVVKAYGMPLDANLILTISSVISLTSSCCVLISIKLTGKRRLLLSSMAVLVCCSIGLSAYGFILFPSNWTSFKNPSDPTIPDFELVRGLVGNYGYLALALFFVMQFFTKLGPAPIPMFVTCEVYSFKLRSFLCGLSMAIRYVIAAIATKSYYNVEVWLTLPGATLFYGIITLIGLIVMYFILPETEGRSLEEIEFHYADNTKKITDIHICMNGKSNKINQNK